jgi:hypothetical protein
MAPQDAPMRAVRIKSRLRCWIRQWGWKLADKSRLHPGGRERQRDAGVDFPSGCRAVGARPPSIGGQSRFSGHPLPHKRGSHNSHVAWQSRQ